MSVWVRDDRERRPDGFEQGLSAAGLGLAQEAYTVEPTSYLAFSRNFGFSVCGETSRISAVLLDVLHTKRWVLNPSLHSTKRAPTVAKAVCHVSVTFGL